MTDRPERSSGTQSPPTRRRPEPRLEAFHELSAALAHRLNNLLLPVTLVAESTRDERPAGADLVANMDKILRSTDRIRAILDRLRILGQTADVEMRSLNFADVAESAAARVRGAMAETIAVAIRADEPLGRVQGDPDLVATALVELVTNAVEAAGTDGEPIEIALDMVEVESGSVDAPAAPGRYLRVAVRDRGPGILPAIADRAFDPFVTSKTDRDDRGLGLAIVQGVAAAHGGALIVSRESGSTVADLYLPSDELRRPQRLDAEA